MSNTVSTAFLTGLATLIILFLGFLFFDHWPIAEIAQIIAAIGAAVAAIVAIAQLEKKNDELVELIEIIGRSEVPNFQIDSIKNQNVKVEVILKNFGADAEFDRGNFFVSKEYNRVKFPPVEAGVLVIGFKKLMTFEIEFLSQLDMIEPISIEIRFRKIGTVEWLEQKLFLTPFTNTQFISPPKLVTNPLL